jgi:hypothetical protein
MKMVKINLLKPKWSGCYFMQKLNYGGTIIATVPAFYIGKNKWGVDDVKYRPHSWPRMYLKQTLVIEP